MTGDPGKRHRSATVLAHPSVPATPEKAVLPTVSEEDAPNELSVEERQVWMKLAPLAMVNGTLTDASALAFTEVCKTVVMVRQLDKAPLQQGTANHSTWKKLLDAQLLNFGLRPIGKPMSGSVAAAPVAPANPLDRFIKRGRGA